MVNKIIGRKYEQEILKNIFHSGKSEFVAVYGRRRIGKTYLIHNFHSGLKCIYFQAVGFQNGSMRTQLESFTEDISKTFYNNEPIQAATSWKEAFSRLSNAMEQQSKNSTHKVILFFDELPWMATPKSGFLEALEFYWNRIWSHNKNLKLIVCGSSASWMIKKLIYNKSGLHNRVTKPIILKPFCLQETSEYLKHMGCRYTHQQVLEIYMAIGGVPFYLNGIEKKLSAMQNINNLCFRQGSILFDEFNKLFSSLFNDAEAYVEIVRAIAKNRYGIARSDIEDVCKLSEKGGTLSNKLKGLEDAGFILSFLPYNHNKRGLFYKVIDEYSLFYLQWIEPTKNSLLKMENSSNFWKNKYKTPAWYSWSGYAFESVCYKHLDIIRRVLNIPDDSPASAWKYIAKNSAEDGAQIDLIFARLDKAYTLCEIKYCEEPFIITKAYVKNLLNKEAMFIASTKTKSQIFMTIIASSGLKESVHSSELITGVVVAEDLFDGK